MTKKKRGRFGGRPNRDLKRVTFDIPKDDLDVMEQVQKNENLTFADVARRACREFADRERARARGKP